MKEYTKKFIENLPEDYTPPPKGTWLQKEKIHMKAKVILFKESGKFYTEEEWEVPEQAIGPWDMLRSKDFRRIANGAVLVETQEPWGYPHLFPTPHILDYIPSPPTHDMTTCADPNTCEDHGID